jgi:hypothetical protein
MKTRWCAAGLATVVLLVGCERGEPRPRVETQEETRRLGEAARHAGRGAAEAVQGAGRGVEYGTRELGQTLSGTQGNPQAEAQSQQARRRALQHGQRAREDVETAGRALDRNRFAPPAAGGGPR